MMTIAQLPQADTYRLKVHAGGSTYINAGDGVYRRVDYADVKYRAIGNFADRDGNLRAKVPAPQLDNPVNHCPTAGTMIALT